LTDAKAERRFFALPKVWTDQIFFIFLNTLKPKRLAGVEIPPQIAKLSRQFS
jgi:hypothetical protein